MFLFFQTSTKYKKFLRQSNFDRDEMIKAKCESLYKRIKAFNNGDSLCETKEDCIVIKTPEKPKTIKETVSFISI